MVSVMASANCLTAFSRALMIVFKPEKRIKHYHCACFSLCFRRNSAIIQANLMTKIKAGFSALSDFESQYCSSSLGKNVGNGCESYDFRLIRLISKKRTKASMAKTNHSSKHRSESNREDLWKEEGPTPFRLKLLSLSYFDGWRSKEGEEKQNS